MSFLAPLFLLGALAVAVPIVLHLLRRDEAPEVPFTAVRLLQKSSIERAERRRLRDLLLLVARVVALLLLATAFARPYLEGAAPTPLRVVAVDRSYSMGGPKMFAAALSLARESIDAAGSDRVAVIAFDDRADVIAPPGGRAEARASLDGLAAGSGATRFGSVFEAVAQIAGTSTGRLIVVSDLQRSGWDGESAQTLPPGWNLELRQVAGHESNVVLSSVRVESGRVVATVRNTGAMPRSGRLVARLDGREVASSTYAVPGRATSEASLAWRAPESGALEVWIDDSGGLPADDSRFVVLTSRARPRPIVVADGNRAFYLSRALAGQTGEAAPIVTGARLASMSPDQFATVQGVALLSTRELDRGGRDRLMSYVREGGGLLLAASPDLDVAVLSEMTGWNPVLGAEEQAGPLTLSATDPRHPIFRPFGALATNLGQVRFDRAWKVSPDGWAVVARFSNGSPALLERPLGAGNVMLLASDVDRRWNDLPLHPAFVPFAVEAMRHVAPDRQGVRDYTVAQVPEGTPHRPGVYQGANQRSFAVNVDERESLPGSLSPGEFEKHVRDESLTGDERQGRAERASRETESRQSFWQYGLVLMIATLVAESLVGRA
jgi:hypothetical protein